MIGTQHLCRALRSIYVHEKLIFSPKSSEPICSPFMVTVCFQPALIKVAPFHTHEALDAGHQDNTQLPVTVQAAVIFVWKLKMKLVIVFL